MRWARRVLSQISFSREPTCVRYPNEVVSIWLGFGTIVKHRIDEHCEGNWIRLRVTRTEG